MGGGGILKFSDLDSLTIFIWGGVILKLSDVDSDNFHFRGEGGILKLSDVDSDNFHFRGEGGILNLYFRIGGILEEFGPKFQPLQQAHASQIVFHILRMWRLIRSD